MSEVARLRIVDLSLWLDLADCVEFFKWANHNAPLILCLLYDTAEEVVTC